MLKYSIVLKNNKKIENHIQHANSNPALQNQIQLTSSYANILSCLEMNTQFYLQCHMQTS